MSTRTVSVDVLLGMIDQMQREFAADALSKMPTGPYLAYYHHGVIRGMETVRLNILNKMKEEDDRARESNKAGGKPGEVRAY